MLRYRIIDTNNEEDIDLLVEWYNDRSIRHLAFPNPNRTSYRQRVPAELLRDKIDAKPMKTYRMYLIDWNNTPIGEMSLEIDAASLKKNKPKSAWFGLVIGEEWARGHGLGHRAMKKLEQIAVEMGAHRAELGVFSFNHRAIKLYERLGYREFARSPRTTWWDGQFWESVHMEKDL